MKKIIAIAAMALLVGCSTLTDRITDTSIEKLGPTVVNGLKAYCQQDEQTRLNNRTKWAEYLETNGASAQEIRCP